MIIALTTETLVTATKPIAGDTTKEVTTLKGTTTNSTIEQKITTMKTAAQGVTSLQTTTKKITEQESTKMKTNLLTRTTTEHSTMADTKKGCKCGVEGPGRRIVDGKEVNPINKYPWLVRLFRANKRSSFCGGTLVASKYVISAAHCMYRSRKNKDNISLVIGVKKNLQVRIGDHNLKIMNETKLEEKFINVVNITFHPAYNQTFNATSVTRKGYDIAILELKETLDLNVYTPACLAKVTDRTTFDGKNATVAGWGRIDKDGTRPDPFAPREVNVTVLSSDDCPPPARHTSELCATKGACYV